MKVFIINSGCNKEEAMIDNFIGKIREQGIEVATSLRESDYVLYVTCAGNGEKFDVIRKGLSYIHSNMPNIKLIVVGCLVYNFKEASEPYLDAPNVKIIDNKEWTISAVNYICDMNKRNTWKEKLYNRTYRLDENGICIEFMLQEGCTNKCSFCKVHYTEHKLSSVPFELALSYLTNLVKQGTKSIQLCGDNLSLYGIDLYGTKRLHELLHELSKLDGLEMIRVSELVPGDMYPELIDEIICNPKVFNSSLQLETASNRLLKLMNRNYTIEEYDYYVRRIREAGKYVDTVLMSGFPTETMEDMDYTISYLKEQGIVIGKICEYRDFEGVIPSSRLPQYSKREKRAHTRYLTDAKKEINYNTYLTEMPNQDRLLYICDVNGVHLFNNPIPIIMTISKSTRFDDLKPGDVISEAPQRLVKSNKNTRRMIYKIGA